MAFITKAEAVAAFRSAQARQPLRKSARQILSESADRFDREKKYDVFVSHCHEDAEVVAGIKFFLEKHGVSVYVDRFEDPLLDPSAVTPATAATLRERMHACASMLFATSETSSDSKWMPWELGYFDGLRQGQIGIFPLVDNQDDSFKGQEYLGLYPVLERLPTTSGGFALAVRTRTKYMLLEDFAAGAKTFREFS